MRSSQNEMLDSYIKALKKYGPVEDDIVCHKVFEEKKGKFKNIEDLSSELKDLLAGLGISKLYSHQSEAIENIRKGRNTAVSSPTASGKTLIYNIPVFESFLREKDTKALYLFPLKALARDQLSGIEQMSDLLRSGKKLKAAVYDGDTNNYQRRKIRENPPEIVLTNPDMIHLSVLPYHEKWQTFLSNLKYIVIDEVHTFRGIFGSNMAWVLRRLIRLCSFYGSNPVFIFLSATIKNPGELCTMLTGQDVDAVYGMNAPSPKKHFIMINGISGASSVVTAVFHAAVYRELRTIVYTKSRKMTELISMWIDKKGGRLKDKIASYRAGFLPEERRVIEQRLFTGELLGVVSTSALELGIDIGALDICILMGYPGSVNSTWQRAGRVGRGGKDALVIMVGGEDALDQYIMRYSENFFKMEPEPAVIFPQNPFLMKTHLECMASELPLEKNELITVNNQGVIKELVESGRLLESEDGKYIFSASKYPQRSVSLRGTGNQYKIVDSNSDAVIGEIDSARVYHETHPGAVYLHNGEHYLITDLDENKKTVMAEKRKLHYFTRYISSKDTEILEVYKSAKIFGTNLSFGRIKVTEIVTGFEKKLIRGQKSAGKEKLDLPPIEFETQGLWIEIPENVYDRVRKLKMHFMGGIHALEHSAIAVFPVIVMCDRNDIGGISTTYHEQLKKPGVFIYDGFSGGAGLCAKAFENFEDLMKKTYDLITGCSCDDGCPACIHSPKCGSGNRPLDKKAAANILSMLLDTKIADNSDSFLSLPLKSNTDTFFKKDKKVINSYCVLDIETRYSAAEVGGWMNAHKMEVSCVVIYDSRKDDYITYYAQDIKKLVKDLCEFDLIIGFNIVRFDYKVLKGYTDFDFTKLNTKDILTDIHKKLGYRLSLDHLAEHTLDTKKSGSGLDALKWWKQGKIEKIVKYCRKDVEITKDIYLFGRDNRYLLFQNKAGDKVRVVVDFD